MQDQHYRLLNKVLTIHRLKPQGLYNIYSWSKKYQERKYTFTLLWEQQTSPVYHCSWFIITTLSIISFVLVNGVV